MYFIGTLGNNKIELQEYCIHVNPFNYSFLIKFI